MKRRIRAVCGVAAALWFVTMTLAQTPSPVGRWKVLDEKTGMVKAIVEVTEVNGELQGTVTRVFSPPAASADSVCERCQGDKRNKPVVGLQILWGLKKNGDEYTGGRVLEAETGKEYRARVKVVDGGQKLQVHGFVGLSFVGRTLTWIRE
jgi:uncharacterized protein (DUF2147 family)